MLMKQNIFLLCIRNMRVYLRCADGAVAEHSLDIPDVHILFQQESGKGMAEHVWGDMLVDPGESSITIDHETDRLIGKLMLQPVYKKISAQGNIFFKGIPINGQGRNDLRITNLNYSFFCPFPIN